MVPSWALNSPSPNAGPGRANATAGRFGGSSRPADRAASKRWATARVLFFLLAFLLLFGGFTLMRSFASSDSVPPTAASETVIFVDEGDTLWQLAASIKKDEMDTREVVHLLMKRNRLDSPVLRSGQTLIVPAGILP